MIDHFMNEICTLMDAILQFCKFFCLPQIVSHLDWLKQMRAEKHLKLGQQKGIG